MMDLMRTFLDLPWFAYVAIILVLPPFFLFTVSDDFAKPPALDLLILPLQ